MEYVFAGALFNLIRGECASRTIRKIMGSVLIVTRRDEIGSDIPSPTIHVSRPKVESPARECFHQLSGMKLKGGGVVKWWR